MNSNIRKTDEQALESAWSEDGSCPDCWHGTVPDTSFLTTFPDSRLGCNRGGGCHFFSQDPTYTDGYQKQQTHVVKKLERLRTRLAVPINCLPNASSCPASKPWGLHQELSRPCWAARAEPPMLYAHCSFPVSWNRNSGQATVLPYSYWAVIPWYNRQLRLQRRGT